MREELAAASVIDGTACVNWTIRIVPVPAPSGARLCAEEARGAGRWDRGGIGQRHDDAWSPPCVREKRKTDAPSADPVRRCPRT